MENRMMFIAALVALAIVALQSTLFTVKEYERAVLFQFGEFVSEELEPGLHFKLPMINTVRKFDLRIQTMDSEAEGFLTENNQELVIDSFVKWRIRDIKQYIVAVAGRSDVAESRLAQQVNSSLRNEVGKRSISEVVAGDRAVIMNVVQKAIDEESSKFGVEVIDVRLKRVDYADKIRESVFLDMESERNVLVQQKESTGQKIAEEIRAKADATRVVTIADAERDSNIMRGEGDATATRIYAEAYGRDAEFYELYRSLEAYKQTFASEGDIMVIEPDSEFFKYFKQNSQ
ncbi:MAG: protease modulator HflC [Arenicella sp.]|jgi:membrane protease subunit HflC|nr:protease modulator HflC [Arenicella sp.]